MNFDDAIKLTKDYFSNEIPSFLLTEEYRDNSGHWGLEYSKEKILIIISCDMGFLEYSISHNQKEIQITNYFPEAFELKVASEENIKYLLNILKKFIPKLEGGLEEK